MKSKRRTIDKLKNSRATIISKGIRLNGSVQGRDNIILLGELKGNVELSGILLLGRSGKINGEINAKNVIIEGEVEGNITATEKVEIHDGGKYKGDIFTPLLAVSEKTYFEAGVKMMGGGKEPTVLHFIEKRSQYDKDIFSLIDLSTA